MLDDRREVVRCLITYSDWWQPATGSVLQVGRGKADKTLGDGLNPRLLDTLEERTELGRRMGLLPDKYRRVLFLWYVCDLHVDDVARELSVSRRHCFRMKSRALETLVGSAHSGKTP